MKRKRRWVMVLIIIGVLVGIVTLFIQWRDGAFLTLDGEIFLSGPAKETPFVSNLDSRKVYRVALDGRFQTLPYYSIDDFNEIRLSEQSELGDVFVVKHFKE